MIFLASQGLSVKTFVAGASVHFCTLHTHRKLPSFLQHIKGVPVAILLFQMSYKALYELVRVTHVRVHVLVNVVSAHT
jgi:hypothetical protein